MQYFLIKGIFANAHTTKKLKIKVKIVLNGMERIVGIFIVEKPIL